MRKFVQKTGAGIVVMLALSMVFDSAPLASAQTSATALTAQIQNLLQQINNLQTQIQELNRQRGALTSQLSQTIMLTRQLRVGMTDEEVKTLQEILAADPEVYPEGLVTGFFGPLTERAVKRFQNKHGIDQAGEVGPKTRNALQKFVSGLTASSTASLPPGLAKKLNFYASSTPALTVSGGNITICHFPPGNPSAKQTITVGVPAWQAHQKHGDTIGACSGQSAPQQSTTTPDIIAPIISNVAASTTASTSAVVSWNTNESANSSLWYGTANPVDTATASKRESETWKTSHALSISGLTPNTTYYFLVSSADAAGNRATSTQSSFVTPQ